MSKGDKTMYKNMVNFWNEEIIRETGLIKIHRDQTKRHRKLLNLAKRRVSDLKKEIIKK